MTELTNLNAFFPDSTNSMVEVSIDGNTTTYKLLIDLNVSGSNKTPATIPNLGNNIIFDGDGHTVTYGENILSKGLFKTLDSADYNITIKNLGVINGKTNTNSNSGFICSANFGKYSTSDIIIENCYSTGNINGIRAGGIVGYAFGYVSSGTLSIVNCYSTGDIINDGSGGIAGSQFGYVSSGILSIVNCYSTGDINGHGAGGISGKELGGYMSYGTYLIVNCYSNGNINGNYAGGIAGESFGPLAGSGASFSIENCYSTGNINGNNAGGICGRHFLNAPMGSITSSIENCYNSSGNYNNISDYYPPNSRPIDFAAFIANLDVNVWDTSVSPPIFLYSSQGVAIIASSSGDPHIFPAFGNMYELPQTPGMFRMLQAPGLVLNGSTVKLTTKQKNDIAHYCESHGILDNMMNSLVMNGVFYDSLYLCADGHTMYFNFNTQRAKLGNGADKYFSFCQKNVLHSNLYDNAYESCEKIVQIQVSFKHSTHGKMTIDLNYFSNPQIKYGIGFSAKKANLDSFSGLLVREYVCESMTVNELTDSDEKEGVVGTNAVSSKFVILKK